MVDLSLENLFTSNTTQRMFFLPTMYELPFSEFRLSMDFYSTQDLDVNPYKIDIHVNFNQFGKFTEVTMIEGNFSNSSQNKVEMGFLVNPGDPNHMFIQKL